MTVLPVIYHDKTYLELAQRILNTGNDRGDRTGTGTRSLFGQQLRFDLSEGFPLLTTKQTAFRIIMEELFWFLRGETNIRSLVLANVHIWDEWPYKAYLKKQSLNVPPITSEEWSRGLQKFIDQIAEDEEFANLHGDLGPVYGSQWRAWRTSDGGRIDQIAVLIDQLKNNPESRSHVVTAWNPAEYDWLRRNSLPPCHIQWQCYVANGKLSLHLYQRSCDYFLGVPFNIASYSALCIMIAHVTGLTPGELVWTGGDVHIYNNHFDQIYEQLGREILPSPKLTIIGDVADIDKFTLSDFELVGYRHQGKIVAPIAV